MAAADHEIEDGWSVYVRFEGLGFLEPGKKPGTQQPFARRLSGGHIQPL